MGSSSILQGRYSELSARVCSQLLKAERRNEPVSRRRLAARAEVGRTKKRPAEDGPSSCREAVRRATLRRGKLFDMFAPNVSRPIDA